MDERAALRRSPAHSQTTARQLTRKIHQSFKADRRTRVEKAGTDIEAALEAGNAQGAWDRAKAWYQQADGSHPKPSREDLTTVTAERVDLYAHRQPPGEPIPILVQPFPIPDGPPSADEIKETVQRSHRGKSPGPTGIRTDHLKDWMQAAYREENHDPLRWNLLVELVQHVFVTGEISTQMTWAIVVLLPKSDGGVRGIGLLDVIWKLVTAIIDRRVSSNVQYHDALHGFRAKRGTGTAILEAKLFQQLARIHQVPVYEIFIDLKKAYDAVDRSRLLAALKGYGVGPNCLRLLQSFWNRQVIVARQGGFYGEPFKAERGVTQGDPFSPTGFNVLVDAIVRYWLFRTLADGSERTTGFGVSVKERLCAFYADDGLLAARDATWLQSAFDVLVGLFERVGLQTNTLKTKTMTCLPGYISGSLSDAAYKRRMTGEGDSYRARKRARINCPQCGKEMAHGSLPQHLLTQHGMIEDPTNWLDAPGRQPAAYRVSHPTGSRRKCPVDGCPGVSNSRDALRRHFLYRHPQDSLVILEEGSHPLPRCELCGMHVPYSALNGRHRHSRTCREGVDRRRQRNAMMEAKRAMDIQFTAKGSQLERVPTFRYLGRPLSMTDDDWPAIYRNLTRARQKWGRFSRLLKREGANPRISGMFYKAVVQSVLLYGCETWVITPKVLSVLGGFHNKVARQLAGRQPRLINGVWDHSPVAEALEIAGLYPLEHYVRKRQRTLEDTIATRPILQLCTEATRLSGSPSRHHWWWTRPQTPEDDADEEEQEEE